jgi:hypothetical protein
MDHPQSIRLSDFRINGVTVANTMKGETVPILVRAEVTSDQPEFYLYMRSMSNLVVDRARRAGVHLHMDRVSAMLIVTHEGGTADLYLQEFPFEIEIMAKHTAAAGDTAYMTDIGDVRRLRLSWLKLQPRDGVILCIKVGWKFALFFDVAPNRDLDVDAMERSLGRLYRRLAFQDVYEVLENDAAFDRLVSAGWFPFVETIGGDFDGLLKAYKNEFNVNEEIDKLVSQFDAPRIDAIGARWWQRAKLSGRRSIVEPALDAFKRGDPVSCLKIVLTEIEGVLQERHILERGKGVGVHTLLQYATEKAIAKAGQDDSLLFPLQFLRYLKDYTYAQFDPKNPDGTVMSRHSVGHGGASANAYTMERALQAILTLDQINFYL